LEKSVNFALSDDDILLRNVAQDFVDKESDLAPLLVPGANIENAGYAATWTKIKSLGWPSLVLPEAYGGAGLGCVELSVIVMELGRTLLPSPFAGHTFGTWALLHGGSREQKDRLLPAAATGATTLALVPPIDGNTLTVENGMLSGQHNFVIDAADANYFVVAARDVKSDWGFYLVDARDSGLKIEVQPWRDITRQVCKIGFDNVAVEFMPEPAGNIWRLLLSHISLFLAAENTGGMRQVLSESVAYANQRVAFGRVIGSFQAIKHPLAEMMAKVESANTAVLYAAWALANNDERASLAASMAKSFSSDAYVDATHRSIQIFGAIGFTWEMSNHLYYKRARANATLFGDPRAHRDLVIREATQRIWPNSSTVGSLSRVA
jgi:alkylation response protein AidB-like acyl-CoA dehydrogenase